VLAVLQMLSKVSVYEVFLHYFEKMSSASGAFALRLPVLCLWIPLGTVLQIPSLPTPGKNPTSAAATRRQNNSFIGISLFRYLRFSWSLWVC